MKSCKRPGWLYLELLCIASLVIGVWVSDHRGDTWKCLPAVLVHAANNNYSYLLVCEDMTSEGKWRTVGRRDHKKGRSTHGGSEIANNRGHSGEIRS